MARLPDNEILYETFRTFLDMCLAGNCSLLWNGSRYWNIDCLKSVKSRMVDSPILGSELPFEEKLEKQMEGSFCGLLLFAD